MTDPSQSPSGSSPPQPGTTTSGPRRRERGNDTHHLHDTSHQTPAAGPQPKAGVLQRVRSLAPSLVTRNHRYEKLDDDAAIVLTTIAHRPNSREASSPADAIDSDLTSLTGPVAHYDCPQKEQQDQVINYGRSTEARLHLTGGLGAGMKHIVERSPAKAKPVPTSRPARSNSIFARVSRVQDEDTVADSQGQAAADALGEIVAIDETPSMDLSIVEGNRHDSCSTFESSASLNAISKQSYYFPTDLQMPDWRPWVMRNWYITSLIASAFVLACIQEFLCQYGMRRPLLSFVDANDIDIGDFFLWKFFPTIVFVAYGVMWQAVNYEVQRTEPYFQLSRPGGALAKDSLCLDYVTTPGVFLPVKAIRHGHYAVFLSSTATLLCAGLVPVFQSASVTLSSEKNEGQANGIKTVRMHPVWSRLMEATLLLTVLLGIALMVQLRRKSGLISDPKGIAGLAAMAQKSHILQDFRGLDVASAKVLSRELRDRRYILYKSTLWQGQYVPSTKYSPEDFEKHNPQPLILRPWAGISYVALLAVTMILVPVFTFTGAHVVTDHLPWLLTAIATVIKLLWNTLELHVRTLQPWHALHRRNAPPNVLTIDYTGTVPGWIMVTSARRKHYLVSMVGFCALLCELLTVCMSAFNVNGRIFVTAGYANIAANQDTGLRYSSGETLRSFWGSLSLAISILLILIIVAIVVYVRRGRAFLPRQPTSIAALLAYIHHSRILHDFVDERGDAVKRVEELDSKEMTMYLERLGKTYGLGWGIGRDGQPSLGIHEEPLLADYKLGTDWREGRVERVGGWDEF